MYDNEWSTMTEDQKLWYFGGLVDGEGYIGMANHGGGKRPIIQLQMTCKKTVQRFAEYFNITLRLLESPSRTEKEHWKPLWHTRAECQKALPILKKLENYLFLKRDACRNCLIYYVGRECVVCRKLISESMNARTKYCCSACRQKAKRLKDKAPIGG
jgi:hypothetical protein